MAPTLREFGGIVVAIPGTGYCSIPLSPPWQPKQQLAQLQDSQVAQNQHGDSYEVTECEGFWMIS